MKEHIKEFQDSMAKFNEESRQKLLSLEGRKTAEDFIAAVEAAAQGDGDDSSSTSYFLSELDYGASDDVKKIFTSIYSFGGEGHGDNYYVVVGWNNQMFCVPGWYNSDAGGEYNLGDAYEVYPKMVATLEYDQLNKA